MPARFRSCGSTASSAPRPTLRISKPSTPSRCSRSPAIRIHVVPWPPRSVMSHHFDYPTDESLDITDAYCFAGAGNIVEGIFSPRTVFGMNTSPFFGQPWNPVGYYELKIDTNGDYVEDI